jgi:beta-galactosidase
MSSVSTVVTHDDFTFSVNNRRVLLISGSVHYPRVDCAKWPALYATLIAAGVNTLETYVFWGEHVTPGGGLGSKETYDFSGSKNLWAFLAGWREAAGPDSYAIVRLGPYVCAEANYGGFPTALRDIPGICFRTLNQPFQDAVEAWLTFLAKELRERKLLAGDGGPIILAQLENEYSMVSGGYGEEGAKYLQWCSDLQHKLQLGVPTIMCYGAADGSVETINSFYAHKQVDALRKARPGQPAVWTEAWTGWYNCWASKHHTRPAEDLAYAVARFCAVGGAGINYYMWMGGTNVGRSPMYLQTTSYDYDAPVDEFGWPTSKSNHLAALHKVLVDRYAPVLFARADDPASNTVAPVPVELAKEVFCYTWADNSLSFVCNDSPTAMAIDVVVSSRTGMVIPSLEPRSVVIVDPAAGTILYNSSLIASTDVVKRTKQAVAHADPQVLAWTTREEPVVVACMGGVKASVSDKNRISRVSLVSDTPVEQLLLTKDTSDYCFYSALFKRSSKPSSGDACTVFEFEACDFAYVYVNGEFVGMSGEPPWEDRKNNRWNQSDNPPGFSHSIAAARSEHWSAVVDGVLREEFAITVLVCALGLVKGDWQLGDGVDANMLGEKKGLLSEVAVMSSDGEVVAARTSPWTIVAGLEGEALGWMNKTGSSDVRATVNSAEGTSAVRPMWFTTTIVTKLRSSSWVLDLGRMGKGVLWVNGVLLGRYWAISGTRGRNGFLDGSPIEQVPDVQPTQRYYHIPELVLKNEETGPLTLRIALFEERGVDAACAGIQLLEVV